MRGWVFSREIKKFEGKGDEQEKKEG